MGGWHLPVVSPVCRPCLVLDRFLTRFHQRSPVEAKHGAASWLRPLLHRGGHYQLHLHWRGAPVERGTSQRGFPRRVEPWCHERGLSSQSLAQTKRPCWRSSPPQRLRASIHIRERAPSKSISDLRCETFWGLLCLLPSQRQFSCFGPPQRLAPVLATAPVVHVPRIIQYLYTLLFTGELVMRVVAEGRHFLCASERHTEGSSYRCLERFCDWGVDCWAAEFV